jgi:Domain of unknown function (DU1801)
MAENKTRATSASVDDFIAAIADNDRRKDCLALVAMMQRVTGGKPYMFGPTIVGFGTYHYEYESGRQGDSCITGFASRKPDLTVYIVPGFLASDALMGKLGKHKTGKACLYIRRLSDVDLKVLEKLVKASVDYVRKTYPDKG